MYIKAFDSVQNLGARYDSEVFQDVTDKSLFVYDRVNNVWLKYRWTSGNREIRYVGRHEDGLPIVTQIYPEY